MGIFDWLRGIRRVRYIDNKELKDRLSRKVLELLVDTKNKRIYHVHPNIGHAETAARVLGIRKDEVTTVNAGHLVSALIEINDGVAKKMLVGTSSLERNAKHTRGQIAVAQKLVDEMINLSLKVGTIKR